MKTKNVMLFCYDFPHKKTQDFILHLLTNSYKIKYVIAAPKEKLNIPKSFAKITPENVNLIHPKKLCRIFDIPYLVFKHNNQETISYLNKNPVDLYLISGTRILSKAVIKAARQRIINIHPGLLPEIKGLDTFLWSIHNDIPLGITAHFINRKVDSGFLIYKEKLTLKKNDAIIDISLRLLENQSNILIKSLKILKKSKFSDLVNLDLQNSHYHTKMNKNLEKETIGKFSSWLRKYSKK